MLAGAAQQPHYDRDYVFDTWTSEQGLPENAARAMVQTPDGYVWIATFNGLARFDGVKFTVFTPAQVPGLPTKAVLNLHVDAAHRLWISTTKGLVVSAPDRWTDLKPVPGWTGNYVRTFAEQSGVLCLTSFDGKIFRVAGDRCEELPLPPGGGNATYYGYVDRTGRVMVAQRNFFGAWDGQRWEASPLASEVLADFRGAGMARDGGLLVCTAKELLRLEGATVQHRVALAGSVPAAWQIIDDSRGTVWVTTPSNGLYAVAPTGAIRQFTINRGLPTNALRFVAEDREHNLWVGSVGGAGLIRIKPRVFRLIQAAADEALPMSKAIIETTPGRIVVGTYGRGLATVESATDLLEAAPAGSGVQFYVQSLLFDRQQRTWVATYGRGVQILSTEGRRELPFADTGGEDINALFEDAEGRIWIGGSTTAVLHDNGRFVPQRQTNGAPLPHLSGFAQSPIDHGLWATASEGGLFRRVGSDWDEVFGPTDRRLEEIHCLRFDTDGTLWIGGAGTGLLRWREGRWSLVGEAAGLPSREVLALLDDGEGNWWFSHGRGVARCLKRDLTAVADGTLRTLPLVDFDVNGGTLSVEFEGGLQNSALRDSRGRLWFATARGAAMVNPKSVGRNAIAPPVVIDSFRIEDGTHRQTTLAVTGDQPLRVGPDTREIAIFFSALSYAAPEKVRFAYRIEGLDDEWRLIGSRRSLYFFLPAPGDYRFHLKAANNDGVWNDAGASVAFTVVPYYWQTVWFRLLVAGVLAGLIAVGTTLLTQFRLRQRIQRFEEQRELAQNRAQFAAVAEGTSDFVAFVDTRGRTTYLNPAGRRLIGLPPEAEVDGQPYAGFHPPAEARIILDVALPAALRDGTWSGESALRHRVGAPISVSQVITAHHTPGGKLDFYSTVARDVTARRDAERKIQLLNTTLEKRVTERTAELEHRVAEVERLNAEQRELMRELQESQEATSESAARLREVNAQLVESNHDLEAFSYSVSHDLRTPLRNIAGFIELLGGRTSGQLDAEARRYLSVVNAESARMSTIIDELLNFSRIGRDDLVRVKVDLTPLVEEVRQELQPQWAGRTVEWKIAALPAVQADRTLLRLVIVNLLGNAVKFTRQRERAEIEVGVRAAPSPDGTVTIFVRDNGAGFNPKYAHKLFGVFQRLHNQREFEGTGIGLANVKRIISRHGGTVWGEGAANQGAVFCFTLPVAPP